MHRRLGVLLLVAAVLTACSSGSDDDRTAGDQRSTSTTGAVAPEAVVRELEATFGPATLAVTVHPLVRSDGALVLTLDVDTDDPTGALQPNPSRHLQAIWASNSFLDLPQWIGLRLIDTEGDRVVPPAVDAAGDAVARIAETDDAGDSLRVQVAYGDPGTDELSLFVPQGGVVDGVPVIDGDVPDLGAADPDDEEVLDPGAIASAPVEPMIAYSLDLDGSARTEAQEEAVTIALGSDVLFAVDSADLTAEAQAVLDEAVIALQTRAPGTVTVTGHTDATASDDYNLDLSQRRADAVAGALGSRIDTADYPIRAEGRGESEPVADNRSEEGRAANRRVELTLATAVVEDPAATSTLEPVPFDGPTATGADGIVVDRGRPYRVGAPRAFVVDGHLVVELTTSALDNDVDTVFGPAIFEGHFPPPPGLDRIRTMVGVAVVDGATAHLPALHLAADAEPDGLVPLTDLVTFSRLDGGDVRTSAVVYPRGVPVGDTVTVQLVDLYDVARGWRLTDIPVERS